MQNLESLGTVQGAVVNSGIKLVGLAKVKVKEFKLHPKNNNGSYQLEFKLEGKYEDKKVNPDTMKEEVKTILVKTNYSIFLEDKEVFYEKSGTFRFRDKFGNVSYPLKEMKKDLLYFHPDSAVKAKVGEEQLIKFYKAFLQTKKEAEIPTFDFSKLEEGKLFVGTFDFNDVFNHYSNNELAVAVGTDGKYNNVLEVFRPGYTLNEKGLDYTQEFFKKEITKYLADDYKDVSKEGVANKKFFTSDLLRPFNEVVDVVTTDVISKAKKVLEDEKTVKSGGVVQPVIETPTKVDDLPF